MDYKNLLLIFIPVIVAVASSYLTYYFTIKSKQKESILKFKEEKYSNLIIFLQGFVGNTANAETKKKFFEEQYKSWLYSSDGVVKSINEMVRLIVEAKGKEPDQKSGKKLVGNIILEMRKDLLKKTKLSPEDFIYTDVIK